MIFLCFFKKRTAYEMRIGDWSSDVCSSDLHFLVAPSKPLGLVAADEACSVVPIDVPLPDGILPEVRIHREIYRARPDIGGIARVQPPKLMSLGVLGRTPVARHGFGSYFHPKPPLWDEPLLVRSDNGARELRSAEHTSELQSLMRISYAVFCLKKK